VLTALSVGMQKEIENIAVKMPDSAAVCSYMLFVFVSHQHTKQMRNVRLYFDHSKFIRQLDIGLNFADHLLTFEQTLSL